ncbi:type II restriction endonuclease [Burkholderia ubonensis]|uniref:type II restriction endonuclease n=1 Tax=Burkholderia ubonensis TaxID=101571 RepID=UPI0009B38CF5|nr:type II restriction endonuclease [Burkholderia ubonensis]
MSFDFGASAKALLGEGAALFPYCGITTTDGMIHPLSTDSKVLAALFEAVVRGKLEALAAAHGFKLETPPEQNYYPDFTLTRENQAGTLLRLAVDVKTTYGDATRDSFKFTLGSYTGCIHPSRDTKNIHYPFSTYAEHWVVGFVYQREGRAPAALELYSDCERDKVPLPLKNVHCFVQEKWRIAGDKPGSGNTSNIGSIEGPLRAFEQGRGIFASDAEFLAYWRNYNPAGDKRYSNLEGFHAWCRDTGPALVPAEVLIRARQAPQQLGLF